MRREFIAEYSYLGQRIKYYRNMRKYTQEQLAEKIDIDSKHLSKIETGVDAPSLDVFFALAKALNVKPRDLMDFSDMSQ